MFLTIKSIHISLVVISFIIFFVRGLMMMFRNEQYRHRLFRIIPPVIDTLLLVTGLLLMYILKIYPTSQYWLGIKMIVLVVYIILGIVALNRTNNYNIQVVSFIAAVCAILFMASLAITHHPLGIFSLLL